MPEGLSDRTSESCSRILHICAQHLQQAQNGFVFALRNTKAVGFLWASALESHLVPQNRNVSFRGRKVILILCSNTHFHYHSLAQRTLHLQVVQGDPTIVHTAPLSLVIP